MHWKTLDDLESAFRFNDAVLRNLVIKRDEAVTEPSPMAKSREEGEERRERGPRPPREDRVADELPAEDDE